MFVFVVPFKSRAVCADWQIASRLCANAIASMLANPSPDIRVILVCSETPEMPSDPRLIVKSMSLPTPQTKYEMMIDKYLKFKMGLSLARTFSPAWLMRADADDLVSCRLVGFITAENTNQFWYSQVGWRHSLGSRFVIKRSDFHLYCGTSHVAYARPEDLPESMDDSKGYYLLQTPHAKIVENRKAAGINVQPIPFPTTIYVVNSGENHSGPWSPNQHDRRTRLKMLSNIRPITPALRREFGFKVLASSSLEASQKWGL